MTVALDIAFLDHSTAGVRVAILLVVAAVAIRVRVQQPRRAAISLTIVVLAITVNALRVADNETIAGVISAISTTLVAYVLLEYLRGPSVP